MRPRLPSTGSPDLAARVQAIADSARARKEAERERNRAAAPEFAAFVDSLERFGPKVINATIEGRMRGITIEEWARRQGGLGACVQASCRPKVKR